MDKLKQKFREDPLFATTVLITGAIVATGAVKAVAKLIESSAYAYRASKV